MALLGFRILLALLLTITSPAWCACAFASMAAGPGTAEGSALECCPADDCHPCDDGEQDQGQTATGQHDDGGLPCRDQSDCACCDSGSLKPAVAAKELSVPRTLLSSDLIPLPALFQALLTVTSEGAGALETPPIALTARGAPPLTAASPLLLHGCLLLT